MIENIARVQNWQEKIIEMGKMEAFYIWQLIKVDKIYDKFSLNMDNNG